MSNYRPLRVFLCHSSGDKPVVRELYQKLSTVGWIDPWLDEEKLYPGQDWDLQIENAVEAADAVIVCLSNGSVTKEGYIQRELRFVLDIALTKPVETIFIIPLRLEDCLPPRRLRAYHYVDYFPIEKKEQAYQRLFVSLRKRADSLGLQMKNEISVEANSNSDPLYSFHFPGVMNDQNRMEIGGIEFVRVPAGKFVMGSKDDNEFQVESERPQHIVDLSYDYWMEKFILTNRQFAEFIKATNHETTADKEGGYYPKEGKFTKGVNWKHPTDPKDKWEEKQDHPVVQVSWDDAMGYCKWFNETYKSELGDLLLHLPTEAEWEKAARGAYGNEWPWGNAFDSNKCNSIEGMKGGTTPVGAYSSLGGDSPYGCADMVGNVSEWTHSFFAEYPYDAKDGREDESRRNGRIPRGGSFDHSRNSSRCAFRLYNVSPDGRGHTLGFRLVVSPSHL